MEVYYYIPANRVEDAVECGLKLSVWFDKEVMLGGSLRKCMSGLLNPKDDIEKYHAKDLTCIKLEVPPAQCFIGDRFLYRAGLDNPGIMKMYEGSIVPVDQYIFGSYRLPECLVMSTVIGGQISVLDRRMDSPILFDNSEELYINNMLEDLREKYDDLNDALLYYFFCKLAEIQKIDKIEDIESKIAVFIDRRKDKIITIKVPDPEQYKKVFGTGE